jgi:hypothetical protein
MSIREVARRHRRSWHYVMGLVAGWATLVVAHRRAQAGANNGSPDLGRAGLP